MSGTEQKFQINEWSRRQALLDTHHRLPLEWHANIYRKAEKYLHYFFNWLKLLTGLSLVFRPKYKCFFFLIRKFKWKFSLRNNSASTLLNIQRQSCKQVIGGIHHAVGITNPAIKKAVRARTTRSTTSPSLFAVKGRPKADGPRESRPEGWCLPSVSWSTLPTFPSQAALPHIREWTRHSLGGRGVPYPTPLSPRHILLQNQKIGEGGW